MNGGCWHQVMVRLGSMKSLKLYPSRTPDRLPAGPAHMHRPTEANNFGLFLRAHTIGSIDRRQHVPYPV
jgi:hypothetical protein